MSAADPLPTLPSPKYSHRAFLIVGFVLTILLSISSIILFYQNSLLRQQLSLVQIPSSPTPIPNPTANWKTFISPTFNFSIKYPNSWTAACKDPEGDWLSGTICDLRAPNTEIDHGQLLSGATIGVGVEKPNQNYKTLEEKIAFDTKNYGYQSTAKTINNIEGYLYTSSSNNVFVAKNGQYFIMLSWIPLSSTNQYRDTIDQILFTFKFLD